MLTISLSISDPVPVLEGNSGNTNLIFIVTRNGESIGDISVNYQTVDGTAQAGTDYVATAGVLTLPAGQSTATIAVPVIGNTIFQSNRDFTVALSDTLQKVSFASHQTFTTADQAVSVAVGDVNGDGRMDLFAANLIPDSLSVLLNTTLPGATSASFSTQQSFATGAASTAVKVGDLNGDGIPDAVITNANSNTVSVLINQTTPGATSASFVNQQTFATGNFPTSVELADINADGRLDILASNINSSTVSLLLNTTTLGSTTVSFSAQQTFATGGSSRKVAVGDVNSDGKADILVANSSSNNTVSVLLNQTTPGATTASFSSRQTFAVGSNAFFVTLGDLNGDGLLDVAIPNESANTVSVLLNQTVTGATTLSFAEQQTFITGSSPRSVAIRDFNLDGRPDLVIGNRGSNTVSVLLNQTLPGATTARFASQQTFATGNTPSSVAATDFNGDGIVDLVVANDFGSSLSVLLNTTPAISVNTNFAGEQTFATETLPRSITLGDFNNDGRADLLIANRHSNTISVLLNQTIPGATPAFGAQQTFATQSLPTATAAADVNGDGRVDAIVANQGSDTLSVLLNQTLPGASLSNFATQATFSVASGSPRSLAAVDVNGDGRPDLVSTNEVSDTLSVMLNVITPGATSAVNGFNTVNFNTGSSPRAVTIADVNGDGLPDIVVANTLSNTVSVLRNQTSPGASTPSFAGQQTFATGIQPLATAVGDVNRDGQLDIVVANNISNTVSVLLNQTTVGSVTFNFSSQATFPTGTNPFAVTLGDVNGDGRPDLLVANSGADTVSLLLNQTSPGASTPSFGSQQLLSVGTGPGSVSTGDVNGDGRADVLVANQNSNTVSVLRNQTTPFSFISNVGTGIIFDDDSQPSVSLELTGSPLAENGGLASVRATLSNPSTQDVTVSLGFSGTATNGADYSASSNTMVILAGQTSGSITLTGINDATFEGNESIVVDVTGVTNGLENGTQSVTATITDDDSQPSVSLELTGSPLAENGGLASVRATLSNPSTQDVTVSLGFSGTATNGADYSASSNTMVILAGQTSGSITLTGINDATFEGNESIVVDVTGVTNGLENGTQSVTATITDDDSQPSVSLELTGSPLAENGGLASVRATLSNPSTQDVTVSLGFSGTATNGADYSASSNTMVILAGQTSGSITLTGINDATFEGNESIVVDVTGVTNGLENGTQSVTATITDDDSQPSVSLELTGSPLAENGGLASVRATLSNPSTQDVTVSLGFSGTATNGADYSASSNTMVILAGQTSGSITLTGINDATFEGNESIVVDVTGVTNGLENGTQSVTATITDDDSQPSVSLELTGSPLAENGGLASVRATLSNPSTQDVTVSLGFSGTATNGADYSASSNTMVILAGQTSGSITLTALDDLLLEGVESIVLDVASVLNGTDNGTQLVTASITDESSDPFQLVGNVLTMFGTSGDDTMMIDYGSSTSSFAATVNSYSLTFSASSIFVDALAGTDSLTVNLSSLADTATLNGPTGSITSSNYAISYANVETTVLNGGASDQVTYNDPGVVNTAYLLPVYGILQGVGFSNQAIAFGNHTVNAAGNDDNLFIYGDTGVQAYAATPTQARMPVGSQLLLGNNFKRVYAYGMGGNDTATYSGSAADETMTAIAFYTFVNTASTVQYFDSFKTLTIAGNGGLDIAVMYDSPGVDTFTASDTSFRYTRSGVFNNIANGYDRVYAFSYFGGFDTATLNGSNGNDRLTSVATYSVLVTPTILQQATGFRTVIVNALSGNDIATLNDATGNDTLNASGTAAELVYGSGRRVQLAAFDTVFARGFGGGTNRKNVTNPIAFSLVFRGVWV